MGTLACDDPRPGPPPSHVGEPAIDAARRTSCASRRRFFGFLAIDSDRHRTPPTVHPRRKQRRHGTGTRDPEADALREVPAVPSPLGPRRRPLGSHLAGQAAGEGTDLVLGRPARRQPGPDRPDGPGPQAPHVHPVGRHGLQGDRGRVPVGVPDRLRFPARDHRAGPDPRRRDHPGPRPVPRRTDRAHLRGAARCPLGHRPLLQLDVGAAAQGRLRPRARGDHRHRRPTPPAWSASSRTRCPAR